MEMPQSIEKRGESVIDRFNRLREKTERATTKELEKDAGWQNRPEIIAMSDLVNKAYGILEKRIDAHDFNEHKLFWALNARRAQDELQHCINELQEAEHSTNGFESAIKAFKWSLTKIVAAEERGES